MEAVPILVMVTPRPQAQTVHSHHPSPIITPILATPWSPQHHPPRLHCGHGHCSILTMVIPCP